MTNHEPLPPIESSAPYSLDFVAHLHGGCYPNDVSPQLIEAVKRDPAGKQALDALNLVQLELKAVKHVLR